VCVKNEKNKYKYKSHCRRLSSLGFVPDQKNKMKMKMEKRFVLSFSGAVKAGKKCQKKDYCVREREREFFLKREKLFDTL
jgi:hypothetical protein